MRAVTQEPFGVTTILASRDHHLADKQHHLDKFIFIMYKHLSTLTLHQFSVNCLASLFVSTQSVLHVGDQTT